MVERELQRSGAHPSAIVEHNRDLAGALIDLARVHSENSHASRGGSLPRSTSAQIRSPAYDVPHVLTQPRLHLRRGARAKKNLSDRPGQD